MMTRFNATRSTFGPPATRWRPIGVIALMLAAAAQPSAAQPTAAGASAEQQIRASIAQHLRDFPAIVEVRPSPVPGLMEIYTVSGEIFYADPTGRHLVANGVLVEVASRRNLTEERQNQINAIAFKDLPLKDALVHIKGNGQRKVAVFADPNCGFCKRLEVELEKLDNVTVYTFLYPVLGPDSVAKSRAVWCAKEPAKAWSDWMLRGHDPVAAPADCESPVERITALGRKYRVNGTPAMVFEDSVRVAGFRPAAQLEQRLDQAARSSRQMSQTGPSTPGGAKTAAAGR